ncbi:MAG: nicotinate phosphoribosyltransferase [Deltaproteobacteria bacterium]|nr:nicotinate phosphoribosyltransferase [Deltaproteobacteria bacterium]
MPRMSAAGSLALLTDLYQLTMAHGYWRHGLAEQRAVFQLAFRKAPFQSGYTLAAGLEPAIELLQAWRFEPDDLAWLQTLTGNDDRPLFPAEFLDYLGTLRFTCDVDAVPEGTAVFPHEPLFRVTGPLVQAQIVETALLNLINFQTLIATKAARVCEAAKGDPVLEFGLRRAQGIDGGLSASRAAYLGGCAATSNVLAGRRFGIPVRGTHAHAWVMSFESELESFLAYAEAMPNNCVFLVDTYDTIEGVRNAIEVGNRLRASGHELVGVRLDSGDLADLSIRARDLLDAAGFERAAIVASTDLDETLIESLKHQGARIGVWGVGTRLVTGYDQPALGGVYKLAALQRADGTWDYKIKLSEQPIKVSNPGILQVRRFTDANGAPVGDLIYDEELGVPPPARLRDPLDVTFRKVFGDELAVRDLLVPVLRGGRRVAEAEPLADARTRARLELACLPPNVRRFLNPHRYPVGLEETLWHRRQRYVLDARK